MFLEIFGDKDYYDEAFVRAYVYKRDGEYQGYPAYIYEVRFTNQFDIEEMIADTALKVGLKCKKGFLPDIRKIQIIYS